MKTAAICILVLAPPVWADACPATPEDAALGIVITYEDGATSRMVLDPTSGMVTEDWREPDGTVTRGQLQSGLHMTLSSATDATGAKVPDSDYTYSYAAPLPAEFAPGQRWQVDYALIEGGEPVVGVYSGAVAAETEVALGPCRYSALPVTLMTKDAAYTQLTQVVFLPGLGVSILMGWSEPFGLSTEFAVVSIEKAPQP